MTKIIPRLKSLYLTKRPELQKSLGLKNLHQVPELQKIVVSAGVGKKREDKRYTETVALTLSKITGQAVTSRLAKKSVAGFKSAKAWERQSSAHHHFAVIRYEFADRLIHVACLTSVTFGAFPARV